MLTNEEIKFLLDAGLEPTDIYDLRNKGEAFLSSAHIHLATPVLLSYNIDYNIRCVSHESNLFRLIIHTNKKIPTNRYESALKKIDFYRQRKNDDMFDNFYHSDLDIMEDCIKYVMKNK